MGWKGIESDQGTNTQKKCIKIARSAPAHHMKKLNKFSSDLFDDSKMRLFFVFVLHIALSFFKWISNGRSTRSHLRLFSLVIIILSMQHAYCCNRAMSAHINVTASEMERARLARNFICAHKAICAPIAFGLDVRHSIEQSVSLKFSAAE